MLLLLDNFSLFLLILTGTLITFTLLRFFELDRDMHAVYLPVMHTSLRQFGILLDFVIDDCVVLDFGVLSYADGVNISEVREDLPDVSLGEIGREVLDSDSREFDAVLR